MLAQICLTWVAPLAAANAALSAAQQDGRFTRCVGRLILSQFVCALQPHPVWAK